MNTYNTHTERYYYHYKYLEFWDLAANRKPYRETFFYLRIFTRQKIWKKEVTTAQVSDETQHNRKKREIAPKRLEKSG